VTTVEERMTNAPTVSVCIPAFARPAFLRAAIESVLNQDFDDLELLVGDDSGGLESALVPDPRIRYFRNPTRLGMAGTGTRFSIMLWSLRRPAHG
jgi:glycosyltransferase involved in cell wall biosynthesis